MSVSRNQISWGVQSTGRFSMVLSVGQLATNQWTPTLHTDGRFHIFAFPRCWNQRRDICSESQDGESELFFCFSCFSFSFEFTTTNHQFGIESQRSCLRWEPRSTNRYLEGWIGIKISKSANASSASKCLAHVIQSISAQSYPHVNLFQNCHTSLEPHSDSRKHRDCRGPPWEP